MNTLLFKCFGFNILLFLMSRFLFLSKDALNCSKVFFCKYFTFKLSFFIKESLKQKVLFIITLSLLFCSVLFPNIFNYSYAFTTWAGLGLELKM